MNRQDALLVFFIAAAAATVFGMAGRGEMRLRCESGGVIVWEGGIERNAAIPPVHGEPWTIFPEGAPSALHADTCEEVRP